MSSLAACRGTPQSAYAAYKGLLAASGLPDWDDGTSYNLWLADGMMLLALRSQEGCGPVHVNTLGFAGTILVKSDDGQQHLREHGPMQVLQNAGRPWA